MEWRRSLKWLRERAKTQNKTVANELASSLYDYITALEEIAKSAMAIHEEAARLGVHLTTLADMKGAMCEQAGISLKCPKRQ